MKSSRSRSSSKMRAPVVAAGNDVVVAVRNLDSRNVCHRRERRNRAHYSFASAARFGANSLHSPCRWLPPDRVRAGQRWSTSRRGLDQGEAPDVRARVARHPHRAESTERVVRAVAARERVDDPAGRRVDAEDRVDLLVGHPDRPVRRRRGLHERAPDVRRAENGSRRRVEPHDRVAVVHDPDRARGSQEMRRRLHADRDSHHLSRRRVDARDLGRLASEADPQHAAPVEQARRIRHRPRSAARRVTSPGRPRRGCRRATSSPTRGRRRRSRRTACCRHEACARGTCEGRRAAATPVR